MSSTQWSRYIRGASAIFAWHIARGESVTVLSRPPPVRFNPSGHSTYQEIEEPIIRGHLGQHAVNLITIVHPMVTGAEEFLYEVWPRDQGSTWTKNFGVQTVEEVSKKREKTKRKLTR